MGQAAQAPSQPAVGAEEEIMTDEQMMQLYTALGSGKGMVRQWIEERGLTPPRKGN